VAGVANVHKHRPRVVACYLYARIWKFGRSFRSDCRHGASS
jgi:hypothetical protein